MKYIIAISVFLVIVVSYFYQAQNSDNTENQKIAEVNLIDSSIVRRGSTDDISKTPDSKDKIANLSDISAALTTSITEVSKLKLSKGIDYKLDSADKVSLSQAAVNKTEINLEKDLSKKLDKRFSQVLDVTFNTDTKESTNGEKGYDTVLWYFLTYKMNDTYKARLWIDIKKDLADSYEEKLNDTKITLSRKGWDLTKKLKISPSVTTVIPISEKSKRNEELNFGLQFNPTLSYSLTNNIRLSYLPRLAKNFHKYKTSRTNRPNTEYKIIQFCSVNYSFTDSWDLGATLIYVNTWSYKGIRRDPSYLTALELGYQVNETLSLAAGTLQGGSVFDRENGPDKTIRLYDEKETTIYGKFALKI
jgi:hypothetical protein